MKAPIKNVIKDGKKYLRVIDANLNRAREGLRVIEDTARFVSGNAGAFKELRAARHRLDRATRSVYPQLLGQRDARSDEGRVIKEAKRKGLNSLLGANFRRVEESLRVLEEYGKLIAPRAAPLFKKMRFRMYVLEKEFLVKD